MIKTAFILAGSAAVLGLAALAVAQESTDDQFMAFSDDRNWYLQRSTCTLAHNVNGESRAVVWFRLGAGVSLEFVDPALRDVRQGVTTPLVVAVDGVSEDSFGTGVVEEGRRGYGLLVSDEMLDRISIGRRLEITIQARTVLRLDLAGAGTAIGEMRTCYEAIAEAEMNANAMDMDMNFTNAMSEEPDNMTAMDMDMNFTNAMSEEPDMTAVDMNYTNAMENAADALENAADAARNAATPEG